ncbi:MAG: EVE domain-containing protein [Lewinellaceae bacterium]|nr:EVE domain-containing protein [Lewinellaceae bacterium]
MRYWLVKSEPDVFSFDQLLTDGIARWDGVRNYQARNNLRAMRVGDLCLYYHSNIGLEIVGIARVRTEFYPDPTAEKGDWSAVDLEPLQPLNRPVSLAEVKAHPALQQFGLVRNPRLSVMPATPEEFFVLLALGETEIPRFCKPQRRRDAEF